MFSASILLMTIIRPRPALAGFLEHAPRVDPNARVGIDHDDRRFDARAARRSPGR